MKKPAALVFGLSLLCCAVASSQTFKYIPDMGRIGEGQTIDGEAILYSGPEMAMRVEILDHMTRSRFIASRIGKAIDPFSIARESEAFFLTMLVQVENRTPARMYVNPSTSVLRRRETFHSPLGYSLLYSYMEQVVKDEKCLSDLFGCIYESAELLGPGERVSKLLIFSNVPSSKRFTLEVGPIEFAVDERRGGQGSSGMTFRFKRLKLKR